MTTDNQTLEQTNAAGETIANRIESRFGLPTQPVETVSATDEVKPDDAFADLEWEGQTLKVPKGLKDAFMRTEDYSKKTSELGEQRRALDQMRQLAETRQLEATFQQSIGAEQQEIAVIDAYLQQATKLDWSQMSTDQMLRHKVEIDGIKERRGQLMEAIKGKREKFNTDMQAKIQELRGKSRELASKSIQGFSEDTEKALREYAKSEGLTDAEIDNVLLDARSYKVLWKAMQYDKVRAGTGKAQEAATKVDRVLRPGAAGERLPAKTAEQLNFNKAMKAAKTSNEKARVIEDRLVGVFSKGQT